MASETSKRNFNCPVAGAPAVVYWQTFAGLVGIGGAALPVQRDYGCSKDADCPHRTEPQCPVRRLNEA